MTKSRSKKFQRLAHIALVLLLSIGLGRAYDPVKVIKLSQRNIKLAISKYRRVLILYHSKWCEASTKAYSKLVELASSSQSQKIRDLKVVLTHFLSREQNSILEEKEVNSFPSLRLYVDKAVAYYNKKDFEPESIMEFLEQTLSQEITTLKSYKKLKRSQKPKIVRKTKKFQKAHKIKNDRFLS